MGACWLAGASDQVWQAQAVSSNGHTEARATPGLVRCPTRSWQPARKQGSGSAASAPRSGAACRQSRLWLRLPSMPAALPTLLRVCRGACGWALHPPSLRVLAGAACLWLLAGTTAQSPGDPGRLGGCADCMLRAAHRPAAPSSCAPQAEARHHDDLHTARRPASAQLMQLRAGSTQPGLQASARRWRCRARCSHSACATTQAARHALCPCLPMASGPGAARVTDTGTGAGTALGCRQAQRHRRRFVQEWTLTAVRLGGPPGRR